MPKEKRKQYKIRISPETPLKSNHVMTVGQRIKFLRAQLMMTQQQLADIVGTNLTYINKVERDRYNPGIQLFTLRRIAAALGCRVYFEITKTPSQAEGVCQPAGPEVQIRPKPLGKVSGQARRQAEAVLHSFYQNAAHRQSNRRYTKTFDTQSGKRVCVRKDSFVGPRRPPGNPLWRKQTPPVQD